MYPAIAGYAGFALSGPCFPDIQINLTNGKSIHITGGSKSPDDPNKYVQSLKVNGQNYTRNWIDWSTLSNGATLEYTMGSTCSSWGTGINDRPPSFDANASMPDAVSISRPAKATVPATISFSVRGGVYAVRNIGAGRSVALFDAQGKLLASGSAGSDGAIKLTLKAGATGVVLLSVDNGKQTARIFSRGAKTAP
jgi:hypothetical protein